MHSGRSLLGLDAGMAKERKDKERRKKWRIYPQRFDGGRESPCLSLHGRKTSLSEMEVQIHQTECSTTKEMDEMSGTDIGKYKLLSDVQNWSAPLEVMQGFVFGSRYQSPGNFLDLLFVHVRWSLRVASIHLGLISHSISMSTTNSCILDVLPNHLVETEILSKLLIDDKVRFGCVCNSWRTLFTENPYKKRLLPVLIIPSENDQERRFFNLYNGKLSEKPLMVPHEKCCRGSGFGWMITTEWKDKFRICVQLISPFRLKNQIIHLPPVDEIVKLDHLQLSVLKKAVLSANPTLAPDNYVVMAIYNDSHLIFYKPGAKAWTLIECQGQPILYHDVICFSKTKQYYAVDDSGVVVAIDVEGQPKLTRVTRPMHRWLRGKKYLVEAPCGDLLQVHRVVDNATFKFQVFRLDIVRQGWIEIKSLGDYMLFLGNNASTYASLSDLPGCKANCIYFTDDIDPFNQDLRPRSAAMNMYCTGVFNLNDGTTQSHFPVMCDRKLPAPVWLEVEPIISVDKVADRGRSGESMTRAPLTCSVEGQLLSWSWPMSFPFARYHLNPR